MPQQVTNYQCPACTGPLRFDGPTGKLKCDYCESRFDVAEIEAMMEEKTRAAHQAAQEAAQKEDAAQPAPDGAPTGWSPEGMRVWSCPSCGAELICDQTTAATACPYCGNPSIVPGQFSVDTKSPDFILPFKLDKKAAMEALKKHYQGKFLLPKLFKAEATLEEVKGVYVPFWLYDYRMRADVGFNATRVHITTTRNERVTTTHHYKLRVAGSVDFLRVPVDGSSKMPDELMDSIEPFPYEELKPFSMAYMPGFLADKYDLDEKTCATRAIGRCKNSAVDAMRQQVHGYDTVVVSSIDTDPKETGLGYAMLPVWLLSVKWKDKVYQFAMNGCTGKLVGNLPVDWGKFWGLFAGIALGTGLLLSLFL